MPQTFWVVMLFMTVLAGPAVAQPGVIQPTSAVEQPKDRVHPLVKPLKIGRVAVVNASKLTDYTAVLYRRMWLGNGYEESQVHLKSRQKPFSVYLLFDSPHRGREVLYVDGWNNNKLYAHEGSGPLSLFSVSLDPYGAQAMEGSKYPITKIGLETLGQTVVEQWEKQAQLLSADQVEVKLYPEAKLSGEECKVVETTQLVRVQGLNYYRTRLFLKRDTNLPFAVQQYAFPRQPGSEPAKVEDVRYRQLKTNVGLTQRDFDPKNPAYNF